MAKRRNFSNAFKTKVAFEAFRPNENPRLRGGIGRAFTCQEHAAREFPQHSRHDPTKRLVVARPIPLAL
jgi:hypothetical protein